MKRFTRQTVFVLAASLVAVACGSTLDDVVVEQSTSPVVPEPTSSSELPPESGDVAVLDNDFVRDEDSIESPADNDSVGESDERLGTRFTWCADIQAEWDALDIAAERYLTAADAWINVELEVLDITDALDLAEAQALVDLQRQQLAGRDSELEDAAKVIGDRLHASAWAFSLTEVGGEFNVDLIYFWQNLFGSDSVPFETGEKTLEVAYARAWQVFADFEEVSDLVAAFYLYYFLFDVGGEVFDWQKYADTIHSALESARNEFYDEDSFADIIRSDAERLRDVDAHLYEAYIAVHSILELQPPFLKQLDDLEMTVHERLSSHLPKQLIDEIAADLSRLSSALRVHVNFMGVPSALEAYEGTRSQPSAEEALLAQETAFGEFEWVIFGLNQQTSVSVIEQIFWNQINSDWEKLVAVATLPKNPRYSEIQGKWSTLYEAMEAEIDRAGDSRTSDEELATVVAEFQSRVLFGGRYFGNWSRYDYMAYDAYEAFQESISESCRTPS